MTKLTASLLALFALGCERPEVYVECSPQSDRLTCTLEQRSGNNPTNTCWEIHLECQNGTMPKARSCQKTAPSGKVTSTVLETEFSQIENCDDVRSIAVANISVGTQ